MTWTDDDVRDEMDEQEEDQLWIDSKGKIVESAFCAYFLQKRPLMYLDQKLFDLDGEVNEERLRHEIHQEIRSAARNDTAKRPNGLWRPSRWKPTRRNGTFSWIVFT